MSLPPCGLYRTAADVAGVPAGRLVYFHNHGDPGPGVYLPSGWKLNRAQFDARGHTLPDDSDAAALTPLPAEGMYRAHAPFFCCEKECHRFEPETLVQLGYNGDGEPILFLPTLGDAGVGIPTRGTKTSLAALANLTRLRVASESAAMQGASDGAPH
jgi:hypothetical protein